MDLHKEPCSLPGSAGVLWSASYYFNARGALGENRKCGNQLRAFRGRATFGVR